MDWKTNLVWLCLAVLFSAFWAVYGVKEEIQDIRVENEKIEEKGNKRTMYLTKKVGILLSEFVGSFAGWCCLYILGVRLGFPKLSYLAFGGIEIFLTVGAVIGIAGYSYKIVESVEKWKFN
ncbi:MAG: hypothetical protein Q8N14_00880 [Candidatus Omnitrophota bacterium]|nr:hypothetical protein [Candidatus Omnitrophota bacterium]